MSTAINFATLSPFPWCVVDPAPPIHFDFIGNLTLAQVMEIYWNTETLVITTTGTATVGGNTANGTGTTSIAQPTSTLYDEGSTSVTGWLPIVSSMTPWASWPSPNQPRARVCGDTPGSVVALNGRLSSNHDSSFGFSLFLTNDPSNAGRYRLYYLFQFVVYDSPSLNVRVGWQNPAQPTGGVTVYNTGTFSAFGLTFSFNAIRSTTASATGGTMSASSTSFTY